MSQPAHSERSGRCAMCAEEAEELRVVGPDHRNAADYETGNPECPECGTAWPPAITLECPS